MRRLGLTPQQRGSTTNGTCPDVFELDDGQFAIVGTDMTDELAAQLPAGTTLGEGGRIVVLTAVTLLAAKPDIPDV